MDYDFFFQKILLDASKKKHLPNFFYKSLPSFHPNRATKGLVHLGHEYSIGDVIHTLNVFCSCLIVHLVDGV